MHLANVYRVGGSGYSVLAHTLRHALRTHDGYPELGVGFESSVPGLHFLGTAAADTFGPRCRFVVGARYAGRALAGYITGLGGHGHARAALRRADGLLASRHGSPGP